MTVFIKQVLKWYLLGHVNSVCVCVYKVCLWSWFSWSQKGFSIWNYVWIVPGERVVCNLIAKAPFSVFLEVNNWISLIRLNSAKIFSVDKLATLGKKLSSSFFSTLSTRSQSVFVAQIVHTICHQSLRPGIPSARLSASETRPCCLNAISNDSFIRREKE